MLNPTTITELDVLLALIVQYINDNTSGDITPADARLVLGTLAEHIAATNGRVDALTTNQVKGSVFRVPNTVVVNGVVSIDTSLIPARMRILGMDARATNGVDAATAQAGVVADPIDFRLLRDSGGPVDALMDEQPATTATVKTRWVRTSGTDAEKMVSFPELILEDHNYAAGDVVRYTFPNGETRLLQFIADATSFTHPTPTGLDSDPVYRSFAPLATHDHQQNTDNGTDKGEFRLRLASRLLPSNQLQRTVLAFEGLTRNTVAAIGFRFQDADGVARPVLEQCLNYTGAAGDAWTALGGGYNDLPLITAINLLKAGKVDRFMLAGTTTPFATLTELMAAAEASEVDVETIFLRGRMPFFILNDRALILEAKGAFFDNYVTNFIENRPGNNNPLNHQVIGATFTGAISYRASSSTAAANTITFTDCIFSKAFDLNVALAAAGGLIDKVNFVRCQGVKEDGSSVPGPGIGPGFIQGIGATYLNQRPLYITLEDCDLTNLYGPIVSGRLPFGSKLYLTGKTKFKAYANLLQRCYNQTSAAVDVLYTDAQLVVDQRTSAAASYSDAQADARIVANTANNLTTSAAGSVLDARQGRTLDQTKAPLASPALTGLPTAPTAYPNTNSNQLATTKYVDQLLGTAPVYIARRDDGTQNLTFIDGRDAVFWANGNGYGGTGGYVIQNRPGGGSALLGYGTVLDMGRYPYKIAGLFQLYAGAKVLNNHLLYAGNIVLRAGIGAGTSISGGIIDGPIVVASDYNNTEPFILDGVRVINTAGAQYATAGAFTLVLRNGAQFIGCVPHPDTVIITEPATPSGGASVSSFALCQVSFRSQIANGLQYIAGQAFTKLVFSTVEIDNANGWDAPNNRFIVPVGQAGIYEVAMTLRVNDNPSINTSYGIGIDRSPMDSPRFFWGITQGDGPFKRQGLYSGQIVYTLAEGEELVGFMYCQSNLDVSDINMVIKRIR